MKVLERWFAPYVFSPPNRGNDFCLQGLERSLVMLAPDISPKQPIDTRDICKIVSGDKTAINIKFEALAQLEPTQCVAGSCNALPVGFDDAAMQRRVVQVRFSKKPQQPFPNFEAELQRHAGMTLVCCNRAYLSAATQHGTLGERIWEHLPVKMRSERLEVEERANVGARFVQTLVSAGALAFAPDNYMPQVTLEEMFRAWREQERDAIVSSRMPVAEVREALIALGVQICPGIRVSREYPRSAFSSQVKSSCWYMGVDRRPLGG